MPTAFSCPSLGSRKWQMLYVSMLIGGTMPLKGQAVDKPNRVAY